MNCGHYEMNILMRDAGELSDADRASLDRHLTTCPSCRAFEASAGELSADLRRNTPTDPGNAFWAAFPPRVWRELQTEMDALEHARDATLGARFGAWLREHLKPLAGVAAAAATAAIALIVVAPWREGTSVREAAAPGERAAVVPHPSAADPVETESEEEIEGTNHVFDEISSLSHRDMEKFSRALVIQTSEEVPVMAEDEEPTDMGQDLLPEDVQRMDQLYRQASTGGPQSG